jgi:hypothetical protein
MLRNLFAYAGGNDLAHVPDTDGLFGSDDTLFLVLKGELGGVSAAIQTSDIHTPAAFFLQHTGTAAVGAIGQIETLKELILQIHNDPPIKKYYLCYYTLFFGKSKVLFPDFFA